MIYGEHGWYFENTSGNYTVAVVNHRLLNKYFNKYQDYTYPSGAEDQFILTPTEFNYLRVPQLLKIKPDAQKALQTKHDRYPKNTLADS